VYIFTVVKNLALNKKRMVPNSLYCLNCTKFGQFILRNIIIIIATRCQILRLKCTRFDSQTPLGEELTALPPEPLAGFKGPTYKGREGREERGGKREEGRGGKEDHRAFPQLQICHYTIESKCVKWATICATFLYLFSSVFSSYYYSFLFILTLFVQCCV